MIRFLIVLAVWCGKTPFPTRAISGSQKKKTPWRLVRKRTIPTERPPLVGEI
jgi:hypothetical protein